MSTTAYTVTFIDNHRPIKIIVFHEDSIGQAFDAAIAWNDEQEYPLEYDAIQIQPSWILWQEQARNAA